MPNFHQNLVLSGGSMRCAAHIGCIRFLEEQNRMKHIRSFVGASAGAMIAFFCCLEYPSYKMESALEQFLEDQDSQSNDAKVENILNIYKCLGIDGGEYLEAFLRSHVANVYGVEKMSFLEFAKCTGKNLVVCATRLTTMHPAFFSVDLTPDVDVIDAIMASTAIPIVFKPRKIADEYFIDGGLVNNFPFDYFNKSNLKDTIGIFFKVSNTKHAVSNLSELLQTLLGETIRKMNKAKLASGENICMVEVDLENMNKSDLDTYYNIQQLKFAISKNEIQTLIDSGYTSMKRTLLEK